MESICNFDKFATIESSVGVFGSWNSFICFHWKMHWRECVLRGMKEWRNTILCSALQLLLLHLCTYIYLTTNGNTISPKFSHREQTNIYFNCYILLPSHIVIIRRTQCCRRNSLFIFHLFDQYISFERNKLVSKTPHKIFMDIDQSITGVPDMKKKSGNNAGKKTGMLKNTSRFLSSLLLWFRSVLPRTVELQK